MGDDTPYGKPGCIDPRAVVDPGAILDEGVRIGPFAVVGPHVRIGRGTVVGSHSVIEGRTTIGADNRIFHFASIGAVPQDLKYKDEESSLIIGDRNRIREFSTIHLGTEGGGMETRVGDDNLFMAYSHIAHDCRIGNGVILANAATLGGHVIIGDGAILGGLTGVHQFCRIGKMAFLAAGSLVVRDVPPFMTVQGDRARLAGLNLEGLKRKGFGPDVISGLKKAYRILFRSDLPLAEAVSLVRAEAVMPSEVEELIRFLLSSERGITR